VSYILEALKKSDQQRRLGQTPTLQDAPALTAAPGPKPGRKMAGVSIGLLLLAAGILIGGLQPWKSEPDGPSQPSVSTEQKSVPPETRPVPVMESQPMAEAPLAQPQPAVSPMDAPHLAEDRGIAEAVPVQPAAPSSETVGAARKMQRDEPASAAKTSVEDIPEQLPGSLQSEIPPLTIAFHAYATRPADRRVMINGEMLRQGETLASGLRVDEITPDGVILGYKGFRFRHNVR